MSKQNNKANKQKNANFLINEQILEKCINKSTKQTNKNIIINIIKQKYIVQKC